MTNAERFCALFAGSPLAHGTYDVNTLIADPISGKLKPTCRLVHTGPSISLWNAHLAGRVPLGVLPQNEGQCAWGCIDIDPSQYQDFDLAALLHKSYNVLNIPLVICRSKSGGCHAFLFAEAPVPVELMRARLAEYLDALGLAGDTEIFPKHDDGLSGWLNMPYHGGPQLNEHGKPYGGRYSVMPYGQPQAPEDFLDYTEFKQAVSWFGKPGPGRKIAGPEPPAGERKRQRRREKREKWEKDGRLPWVPPPAGTWHYEQGCRAIGSWSTRRYGLFTDAELEAEVSRILPNMERQDAKSLSEYRDKFIYAGKAFGKEDKDELKDRLALCRSELPKQDLEFFENMLLQGVSK